MIETCLNERQHTEASLRLVLLTSLIGLSSIAVVHGATDSQRISVGEKLQIPGTTLKAGEYIFSVEDRLQDRAIVRITDVKGKTHDLLLAIPSDKLTSPGSGQLLYFPNNGSDKKILQGWMCGSCTVPLEFVYPKAEAVKITGTSAKGVLAVDPVYDKLPKRLSQDDMKVVTLWLLSPKEITPDQKGKGVEAAKVADLHKGTQVASAPAPVAKSEVAANSQPPASPAPTPEVAAAPAPVPAPQSTAPVASATPEAAPQAPVAAAQAPSVAPAPVAPVQTASVTPPAAVPPAVKVRRMPHTASNTYAFGVVGLLSLAVGLGLSSPRRVRSWSFRQ